MVNPFDLRTALLAKHSQHVVLIHFPIALFITAVVLDLIAQWTKRQGIADAAYYNLLVAASFNGPGSGNRDTRVAVPTRGPETERHPIAAPGTCMCLECDDLAGLVGAFPWATADRGLAELPPGG